MNHKLFFAIGIFWLIIIGGFVAMKESTLRSGTKVLLQTEPVDPRDLFRGDYVTLRYDISEVELFGPKDGSTVYVLLDTSGKYATVYKAQFEKPASGIFLKGTGYWFRGEGITARVEYGIESYFVPEGEGRKIENYVGRGLAVRVAIDADGRAVIKDLVFPDASSQSGGNVIGSVRLGPTCPVVQAGDSSCADRPYAGALVQIFSADPSSSFRVASAITDADGNFSLTLPSGEYTASVMSQTQNPYPICKGNVLFSVAANERTILPVIYCDTGIR